MIHPITFRDSTAVWNDLFTDEEIDTIVDLGMRLNIEQGKVASQEENDDVRKSKIAWIYRTPDTEWIFSRYDGAMSRLNSAFFGVDIEPLQSLQFTIYENDGDHYTWHWDMNLAAEPDKPVVLQQRKLSMVTQLSDPDEYEGGDLELAPCGTIFTVEKKKGMSVVFPSFVNHRVNPVTKGERFSLVAWYEGPDWR